MSSEALLNSSLPHDLVMGGISHGGSWQIEVCDVVQQAEIKTIPKKKKSKKAKWLPGQALQIARDGGACWLPSMMSHRVGHD